MEAISQQLELTPTDLLLRIAALEEEIEVRKRYGHFCCAAHAEAALAEKRATGVGPWENIHIASAQILKA